MISTLGRWAGVAMMAAAATATGFAALADEAGAGESQAAIEAFDQTVAAAWAGLPFATRAAVFTEGADNAYAIYTPRASSTFHAGDAANIYLEPVGYGFIADGEMTRVSFKSGIEIRTADGLILGRTDDFATLDWSGRTPSYEVPATISVTLPALKPGDYLMDVTLTDAASSKALTVTLPFAIAAP